MNDGSANIQTNKLDIEDWENNFWKAGRIQFHMPKVNDAVIENAEKFIPGEKNVVLVPLCGKTLDMKWMYDQGHTVVGVEAVEMAVVSFFTENNLQYTVSEVDEGKFKLYESEDKRLKLLLGDFFKLESKHYGEPVDGIWDRGALVAVSPCDRQRYVDVINRNLRSGGKMLLECYEYDPTMYKGPPHHVPQYHVRELFEPFAKVELLKTADFMDKINAANWRLSSFNGCHYLIVKR